MRVNVHQIVILGAVLLHFMCKNIKQEQIVMENVCTELFSAHQRRNAPTFLQMSQQKQRNSTHGKSGYYSHQ